jgi:hypothetical protein
LKTNLLTLFLLLILTKSFAQNERKNLYPIEVKKKFLGIKYIYDRQTIENPLALQIPMLQARDTEVNVEFLRFKQQRKSVQIISLVSTGFSLYTIFNREKVSSEVYWGTFGVTVLVSGYLNIKSNQHLAKALIRYNEIVSENKIGLIIDKSFQNQAVVGVGFSHSF